MGQVYKMAPKYYVYGVWLVLSVVAVCSAEDQNCADLLDNCEMYGQDACVGKYKPWASVRCRAYCGFCTGTPTEPPPCRDMLPDCQDYQWDMCTNPDYFMWARYNCKKFCRFCQPETTSLSFRTPPMRTPPHIYKTPPPLHHIAPSLLTPPHRIIAPPTIGRRSPKLRK